jgi:hypothetical protein
MPESRWRLLTSVGIGVGLLLALGQTTGALWADAVTVTGTSMTTGLLDAGVEQQAVVDLDQALPGETTTAQLVVGNDGSVPFDYTVDVTGAGDLFAALAVRAAVGDCDGPLVGAGRSLAPGQSQQVCVRVTLPASAPASVAGESAALTVSVVGVSGGWSDRSDLTGWSVTTTPLTVPTLSCGNGVLGAISIGWAPVPHATAYRIHYGPSGGLVDTVPATTLSRTFTGVAGVATVEAVFGSSDWVSPASEPRTYSALAGVLGSCS